MTNDLISREAAIALLQAISEQSWRDDANGVWAAEQAIEALTSLPSATIFETRPANLEFFESDQP